MIKKWFSLTVIVAVFMGASAQETMLIRRPDTTYEYQIIWDSINPTHQVARYAMDTSLIAIDCYLMNGLLNGNYKVYYPSGSIAEWRVYAKNKKNGDYTLYDTNSIILIKGKFVEDIKDGYWTYRYCNCHGRYKKGVMHRKWKCGVKGAFTTWFFIKGKLTKGVGTPPVTTIL